MPAKRFKPQAIAIGDQVYVGGGGGEAKSDRYTVIQYDTVKHVWTSLPDHCACWFGLCQFQGALTSVGGFSGGGLTDKVYRYSTSNKKWVEFLKPMPTKRSCSTLLTTASAIIVCGGQAYRRGRKEVVQVATVEVYSSTTSQWHTADPLPKACTLMSSVTINESGFLMGGGDADNRPINSPFCVDMATLVDRATSPIRYRNTTSPWKTLPDTPLTVSTVAPLSGRY